MIRRPPRSTLSSSSAASDVYKRQTQSTGDFPGAAMGCGGIEEEHEEHIPVDSAPEEDFLVPTEHLMVLCSTPGRRKPFTSVRLTVQPGHSWGDASKEVQRRIEDLGMAFPLCGLVSLETLNANSPPPLPPAERIMRSAAWSRAGENCTVLALTEECGVWFWREHEPVEEMVVPNAVGLIVGTEWKSMREERAAEEYRHKAEVLVMGKCVCTRVRGTATIGDLIGEIERLMDLASDTVLQLSSRWDIQDGLWYDAGQVVCEIEGFSPEACTFIALTKEENAAFWTHPDRSFEPAAYEQIRKKVTFSDE
eukprot:TRINITY_DN25799_c0_g2_i2.p1 TRINITY_DN25799_c0_g2~~TRINITY_DN25799_c0_g2_i2.p1  ORF type:complete len:308 (+),score=67.78 TRINITY_DN25799_c0_g2_i2:34-957(+)